MASCLRWRGSKHITDSLLCVPIHFRKRVTHLDKLQTALRGTRVAIGTDTAFGTDAPCARIGPGGANPSSSVIHSTRQAAGPKPAHRPSLAPRIDDCASRAWSSVFDGSETRNAMFPTSVAPAATSRNVPSWEYGKPLKQPLLPAYLCRLTHEGSAQLTNWRYRHHSGLYR